MFVYYFLFAILLLCISLFYCVYRLNANRRYKKKLVKKKLRFNTMSDILYYSEDDDNEKIKMKIKTKNM